MTIDFNMPLEFRYMEKQFMYSFYSFSYLISPFF